MPQRSISRNVLAGKYYINGVHTQDIYEAVEGDVSTLSWGAEGHYGYPNFDNGLNVGGSFLLNYDRVKRGGVGVKVQGNGPFSSDVYQGTMYCHAAIPWGIPAGGGTNSVGAGSSYGPEAYAKMKPDKPNMAGLNAIYELKDLPGMLRQRFLRNGLSSIGNYWLALKFGWEPLLRDVRSFVQTQMDAQKRLDQLLRDEGRPVRRKITLVDEDRFVTPEQFFNWTGYFGPSLVTYFYNQWGAHPVSITRGNHHTAWASARMRYWLPGGPRDIAWTRSMKESIFGLTPSPAAVYNAIPWSWLVDWFTNLGYCIDNIQTTVVDRLAADYFYVMYRTENFARVNATTYMTEHITGKPLTISASSEWAQGTKMRLQGDPFGFGTSQNSLNGTQLSILGALGLSRIG